MDVLADCLLLYSHANVQSFACPIALFRVRLEGCPQALGHSPMPSQLWRGPWLIVAA